MTRSDQAPAGHSDQESKERLFEILLPSDASAWKSANQGEFRVGRSHASLAALLQSSAARLLNAMASLRQGRDYLSSCDR